jgi:fused signal recognition particle receptor
MSFLKRLKEKLQKSSTKISEGLKNVFVRKKLDQQLLDDLEEILILSDLGYDVSARIIKSLKEQKFNKEVDTNEIKELIAHEIKEILEPFARPIPYKKQKDGPFVLLIVGVNGTGKTTTIAKLAKGFQDNGLNVTLAAGDTFRAAAVEQLEVWSNRLNMALIKPEREGEDPASLAFNAYKQCQKTADVLLIDTAGRLHNKNDLMNELSKIHRVLKKIDETIPHEVILVLDATTGQNAHAQVEFFLKSVPISGLILTKLDGTAKGGVVVALAEKYRLPLYALGIGEHFDDLQPFNAHDFAKSLIGVETNDI